MEDIKDISGVSGLTSTSGASLNYIGSKHKLGASLLHHMMPFLEKYKVQTIADLFCGSGSMSKIFYQNYNVVSNDIMAFASIVTSAQLSSHSEEYAKWIEHLNKVPNVEGFITKEYSPKGHSKRMFFTEDTALKIDGMRIELEKIKHQISEELYIKLLGTIIHCADKHANVASVYGAFLKDFKEVALKDFELKPTFSYFSNTHPKKFYILNNDILTIDIEKIQRESGLTLDAVYLDPPYNQRSYSKNYSPLETIAKYDDPEIKGKTGLRVDSGDFSGLFCKKSKIERGMNKMLIVLKNIPLIFMSYNNEGLLTEKQIEAVCDKHNRKISCIKIQYERFASKKNQKRNVEEYLFVIENK